MTLLEISSLSKDLIMYMLKQEKDK